MARALPDDADATIEGTLTTALGALEAGRSAFVQDETGGIGIYLDATVVSPLPAGTTVRVAGTLGTRFAQRVLRVDEAVIEAGPVTELPRALDVSTGAASEAREGWRIAVTGVVDGAPGPLSDGLGLTVDDGSGPVRAVIGPAALAGLAPMSGDLVTVRGPLGQRDSSGTGAEAIGCTRCPRRLRPRDAFADTDPHRARRLVDANPDTDAGPDVHGDADRQPTRPRPPPRSPAARPQPPRRRRRCRWPPSVTCLLAPWSRHEVS